MFGAALFILAVVLIATIVGIVVHSIVTGLFQTPEVPATGATRSRAIQH